MIWKWQAWSSPPSTSMGIISNSAECLEKWNSQVWQNPLDHMSVVQLYRGSCARWKTCKSTSWGLHKKSLEGACTGESHWDRAPRRYGAINLQASNQNNLTEEHQFADVGAKSSGRKNAQLIHLQGARRKEGTRTNVLRHKTYDRFLVSNTTKWSTSHVRHVPGCKRNVTNQVGKPSCFLTVIATVYNHTIMYHPAYIINHTCAILIYDPHRLGRKPYKIITRLIPWPRKKTSRKMHQASRVSTDAFVLWNHRSIKCPRKNQNQAPRRDDVTHIRATTMITCLIWLYECNVKSKHMMYNFKENIHRHSYWNSLLVCTNPYETNCVFLFQSDTGVLQHLCMLMHLWGFHIRRRK